MKIETYRYELNQFDVIHWPDLVDKLAILKEK